MYEHKPAKNVTPQPGETTRQYAVRVHDFTGTRGRLPKEIISEFVALYGEVKNLPKPVAAPTGRKRGRPRKNETVARQGAVKGVNAAEGDRVVAKAQHGTKPAYWNKGGLMGKTDAEVIELVQGRKISWENEKCRDLGFRQTEEAYVDKASIIVTKGGRRCLQFVPVENGQYHMASMRVVALESL